MSSKNNVATRFAPLASASNSSNLNRRRFALAFVLRAVRELYLPTLLGLDHRITVRYSVFYGVSPRWSLGSHCGVERGEEVKEEEEEEEEEKRRRRRRSIE
ncbi:hypothetical protein HZH68_004849 [Vespula germanica]|uniref:Uncharacterized protein n=1 Tax=Vespula germanica TaxID=30212 RepID=A0A834KPL1_VESGE|nr:hypothetical protein HZH68_004849 [Vespula germanica]